MVELRRWAIAAASFCVEAALQVSGYTNWPVTVVLAGLGLAATAWAVLTSPQLSGWLSTDARRAAILISISSIASATIVLAAVLVLLPGFSVDGTPKNVNTFSPSNTFNPSNVVNVYRDAPTATPLPPNSYVCITPIEPFEGHGRYAVLVEAGVLRDQSNGLAVRIKLNGNYNFTDEWWGAPLRVKKENEYKPSMVGSYPSLEQATPPLYQRVYTNPNLTPHTSHYFYFEADQPVTADWVLFTDDFTTLNGDQRDTAGRDFGPCPRAGN